MKKALLILTLVTGSAIAVQAQNNIAKLNTVSLLLQTGSFFYEHKVNAGSSLNLGLFITHLTNDGFNSGPASLSSKYTGFGLTGEYRFYTGGEALHGFFIGPYLRFQDFNLAATRSISGSPSVTDKATLTTFGGGLVLGWQKVFGSHLTLEPFLGLGYAAGTVDNLDDNNGTFVVENGFRGLEFRPGFSLGYAFGKKTE